MTDGSTCVVHAGNVDGDPGVEMITGGRAIDALRGDNHQIRIRQLSRERSFVLWVWLDRLENVFAWEGRPLYATWRDSLPFPWPDVVYTVILIGVARLALFGLWRMRSLFRQPQR